MLRFRHESAQEIIAVLEPVVAGLKVGAQLSFVAPDPDLGAGQWAGEALASGQGRHRGYRTWLDFGECFGLRMLTPRPDEPGFVCFRFQKLAARAPLVDEAAEPEERYGKHSPFFRLNKFEELRFALDHRWAQARIPLREGMKILCLGVHRGDELAPLLTALATAGIEAFEIHAIDQCGSAMAVAAERFDDPRLRWYTGDIRDWPQLPWPKFDYISSIATLQSPGVDGKNIFPKLLRERGHAQTSVLLGFPNLRYVDGEVEYGARMRNFREPELSLLMADVLYFRRVLTRRNLAVAVSGKHYVFVTGRATGSWPDRG